MREWRIRIFAAALAFVLFAGCDKGRPDGQNTTEAVTNVVTADIQGGIEKHIEEQTRLGEGYFRLTLGDSELLLKLVRVHTEYLANLGPRSHFACVDLVDTKGDVYDVDFFLEGDPGAMAVTKTMAHKINGKPFYAWKQKRDGTWARVPAEKASQQLLGVINSRDQFEFMYQATLPKMTDNARMWIPMATTNSFQTVEIKDIKTPGKYRIIEDREYGNKLLFLELEPKDSKKQIYIRYHVKRIEKAAYTSGDQDVEEHIEAERLVPSNENFRTIAKEVVEGKKSDLMRARAIYDHVIDRMRYAKYGTGWGRGDAVYACDARNGNCTDFHAYFIALARSVGIPARFAIGAAIPSERNEGGVDGYHCWAEFHADGKWWPIDISEADKYSSLSTYYFGHHPANRLEFSRGRDLVVEPLPASGPINFLAYPVLEIAGKTAKATIKFSFNRTAN